MPYPDLDECEDYVRDEVAHEEWALQRDKRVYLGLAHQAYRLGFKGSPVQLNHAAFWAADVAGLLRPSIDKRAALIEGLEAVVGELSHARQEEQARREGYGSPLEMRLAGYAEEEARERRGYGGAF